MEDRELAARLEDALHAIPSSYREVFVLKQVEELSYEEIAEITGHSVGSLKVRAHRARALLREGLREEFRGGSRDVSGRHPGDELTSRG